MKTSPCRQCQRSFCRRSGCLRIKVRPDGSLIAAYLPAKTPFRVVQPIISY